MNHVQLLATALALWIINPFNMMILMATCHELRVIRSPIGERHIIGFAEEGLDLISWFAMALCAFTAAWIHRSSSNWQISVAFTCVVLLQGLVLLRRYESGQRVLLYTRVHLARRVTYAAVLLLAGSLSFAM